MRGILVLNAGSSSLKFALYRRDEDELVPREHGEVEGIGIEPRLHVAGWEAPRALTAGAGHEPALEAVLEAMDEVAGGLELLAAGHRIVHGGPRLHAPVRLDDDHLAYLRTLEPLAPLHQPHNLRAVDAVREVHPDLPQVGCFDTAFHRTQPRVAQRFALPRRYGDEGVLRYGFHGLSYQAIAERLPEVAPEAAGGRTVVAHLGAGASLCALRGGQSVDTTMGFTALDGLPMGQRCGSLDPGVVLYMLQHEGLSPARIEQLLYRESGLLGVSGQSPDMRALLDSERAEAAEAVELFVYRCVREIGALAAVLGGLDALVFTAGIGERSAAVRARIVEGLEEAFGMQLDPAANAAHGPRITAWNSDVTGWVLPTDEEGVIARSTLAVVG